MVSLITRTNLNLQAENKRLMQELEAAMETERRNREQQQKKVAALKEELLWVRFFSYDTATPIYRSLR